MVLKHSPPPRGTYLLFSAEFVVSTPFDQDLDKACLCVRVCVCVCVFDKVCVSGYLSACL